MTPKPPTCEGCPAISAGKGYVPGEGPTPDRVRLALVGQGPGEQEAHFGKPFVGPSGYRLDKMLVRAGVRREECWVDNVVRCWLPGNRPPTVAEVAHCTRVHLVPSLERLPHLRVVVPIGVPAGKWLFGSGYGEGSAGTMREVELPSEGTQKPPKPFTYFLGGRTVEVLSMQQAVRRPHQPGCWGVSQLPRT